jgi:hypothetical protein
MKLRWILALAALVLASCAKKTQNGVVIGKEYIPAHGEGMEYRERQTDREQWWVTVEMTDGRKANAPVDLEPWKAFKIGQRVRADYSEGKYTGTIWGIEIHPQ